MHGARLSIAILFSVCLIPATGCRTSNPDASLHADNTPLPTESGGGIVEAFARQLRGTRNKNAQPTSVKPASARLLRNRDVPQQSANSKEKSDAAALEHQARSARTEGLLGAFDDASPEVQAAARRLAAAQKMSNKNNVAPPTPSTPQQPFATNLVSKPAEQTARPLKDLSVKPVAEAPQTPVRQVSVSSEEASSKDAVAFASAPPATADAEPNTTTIELEEPTPEESFSDLTMDEQLAALIENIKRQEKQSIDTPEGLRQATTLRMLYLLSGKLDEAVSPVADLATAEQEYLRHQLMTLWDLTDTDGSPSRGRRWSKTLENLQLAASNLAAATETLDVTGIAFCTEVESYGRITPFADYKFEPGQQVILYCEIDHFAAERLSDGYETHFQGSYDVFDAEGVRVAEQVLPADKQTCNNFRRDYFIAYRLYLPKRLEPGAHRIQLTVEDLKGKKYGQSVLDFEIVAAKESPAKK